MFVTNSEMICLICYYKFLRKHADKRRDLHFWPMSTMHVFFPIAMMTCGQNSVYPKFVLNQYIYIYIYTYIYIHIYIYIYISWWKFIGRWSEHTSYLLLLEEWAPHVGSTIGLTSHVRGQKKE